MTDSSPPSPGANAFRKEGIMPELHTTKPEPKRHDFAAGETGVAPPYPPTVLPTIRKPVNGMAGACPSG